MRFSFPFHVALAAASGLLAAPGGAAQPQQLPEYLVKARYVLALADYVTWPPQADLGENGRPLVLGILGTSPFEAQVAEVFLSRQVKGKQLTLHFFKSLKEYDSCDILFVCESEGGHLQEILKTLKGKPVLTIADTAEFARRGVMINLYLDQARVKFEINLTSVRASGLEVGSRVLKLAKLVE